MKDYHWIYFSEVPPKEGAKTKVWLVCAKADGGLLGAIRWFGRWRKYSFYPENGTVYEQDCLWDIADFVAQRTVEHKETWKAKVTA